MKMQSEKLETFAHWACLPINNNKCALTCALHHSQGRNPPGLSLNNKAVPFKHSSDPYKYLGLWICPDLDWTQHRSETVKDVQAKGKLLVASLASPRQKLNILKTKIKAGIQYSFGAAPYTMQDITLLDREIAKIAKQCFRLSKSFSTSAILRECEQFGLGLGSLSLEYNQTCATCLTRHLNDKAHLGAISRSLLTAQTKRMQGAPVHELNSRDARFCMRLRQRLILDYHGFDLIFNGESHVAAKIDEAWSFWPTLLPLLERDNLPASIFHPLVDLVSDSSLLLGSLANQAGTHLIDTNDLERAFGSNIVTREHKVAINRLSCALSGTRPPGKKSITSITSTKPLPSQFRSLPPSLITQPRPDRALPSTAGGNNRISFAPPTHLHRKRKEPDHQPSAPPAPLPFHVQQGLAPSLPPQRPWHQVARLRQFCHLDTRACNPDHDVLPCPNRQHFIQIGQKDNNPSSIPHHTDLAFVYDPDGRFVGQLDLDTLERLLVQFSEAQQLGLHSKQLLFEEEVALLLQSRHLNGKKLPASATNELWVTHPDLMQALANLGDNELQERFASPLDRSRSSSAYWSHQDHPRDSVFGANSDAFSVPWTGLSQAYCGTDPDLTHKALRWAIASVELEPSRATCSLLLIDNDPTRSYYPLLHHPRAKVLASIRQHSHLQCAVAPQAPPFPAQASPHSLLLVAVSTEPGAQKYLAGSHFSDLQSKIRLWHIRPWDFDLDPSIVVKPPHALKRLLDSGPSAPYPNSIGVRVEPPSDDTQSSYRDSFPCTQPLCRPPIAAFTDGSCIRTVKGPAIGAAVCFRRSGEDQAFLTLSINPGGRGPTNTINRAELCAILRALVEWSNNPETLYIYTDSKCGIDLIRRIINAPWSVSECKHLPLLQAIADAIEARASSGFHTYIYKVISHSGIHGNDEADREAKKAAVRFLDPSTTQAPSDRVKLVDETTTADAYTEFWLSHQAPPATKPDGSTQTLSPSIIPNLSEATRRLPAPSHSGGSFQTQGTYAEGWTAAAPFLETTLSNAFLALSKGTHRQRMIALKARWGMLYTRLLAHRYKAASSPRCPRCNHPMDSVSHLLSGECKETEGLTTLRHDTAVKMIQKCIKGGRLGSSFTIMDAGKKSELPSEVSDKRIPTWILPLAPPEPGKRSYPMRPDILVVESPILRIDPDTPRLRPSSHLTSTSSRWGTAMTAPSTRKHWRRRANTLI